MGKQWEVGTMNILDWVTAVSAVGLMVAFVVLELAFLLFASIQPVKRVIRAAVLCPVVLLFGLGLVGSLIDGSGLEPDQSWIPAPAVMMPVLITLSLAIIVVLLQLAAPDIVSVLSNWNVSLPRWHAPSQEQVQKMPRRDESDTP